MRSEGMHGSSRSDLQEKSGRSDLKWGRKGKNKGVAVLANVRIATRNS